MEKTAEEDHDYDALKPDYRRSIQEYFIPRSEEEGQGWRGTEIAANQSLNWEMQIGGCTLQKKAFFLRCFIMWATIARGERAPPSSVA